MKPKLQPPVATQLSLSYGKPLAELLKQIQQLSRSQVVQREVMQIQDSLQALEVTLATASVKSPKVRAAILELLSK